MPVPAARVLFLAAALALCSCSPGDMPTSMSQGGDVLPGMDSAVPGVDSVLPEVDGGAPDVDSVSPREDLRALPEGLPQEFLEQDVLWEPCVLHENDKSGAAECADIAVPFYWNNPEAGDFTVHVKRLIREGSERQFFMLEGGPGLPGTVTLSHAMEQVFHADMRMDVYAIDHRGTGLSHPLECPAQESPDSPGGVEIQGDEWEACALYLETEWVPWTGSTSPRPRRTWPSWWPW